MTQATIWDTPPENTIQHMANLIVSSWRWSNGPTSLVFDPDKAALGRQRALLVRRRKRRAA